MAEQQHIVGIDVAKARLDIHLYPDAQAWSVPNSHDGWRSLEKDLRRLQGIQIAMEASGGYERGVAEALARAGFDVHILDAGQVRAFARGIGCRAKTDPLDAQIIARCLDATGDKARPWRPDTEQRRLADLVSYRTALMADRVVLRGRLDKAYEALVEQYLRSQLDHIDEIIAEVEKEVAILVKQAPALKAKNRIMRSMPGVGPVLATTLLSKMPELGHADDGAIAALAGVAPYDRQSGQSQNSGKCQGGRSAIRRVLYMAVRTAVQGCNPPLKRFDLPKRQEGKPDKVAMVATMRKMLVILNAMLRKNTMWVKPA